MASHIERRKFLATLGGAAAAWPLAARRGDLELSQRSSVRGWIDANCPSGT
jgi:hypothetical protein